MPAALVPNEAIPKLASQIDSPATFMVLQYLQQAGLIRNGEGVDDEMAAILQRLTGLGLIDPGYSGPTDAKPYLWTINGNGSRVLEHIETSPPLQATLQPKVRVHLRAHTALTALPDWDRLQMLSKAESLQGLGPASWPEEKVIGRSADKSVYLLQVFPDLRGFLKVLDSGEIELFDVMRAETLRLFLEQSRAGSKVG